MKTLLPSASLSLVVLPASCAPYGVVDPEPRACTGAASMTRTELEAGGVLCENQTVGVTLSNAPNTRYATAASMVVVPQLNGRDLEELTLETRAAEEWARLGSYVHRPLATVPVLASGTTNVTIGAEGHAEWRTLKRAAPVTISGYLTLFGAPGQTVTVVVQ